MKSDECYELGKGFLFSEHGCGWLGGGGMAIWRTLCDPDS